MKVKIIVKFTLLLVLILISYIIFKKYFVADEIIDPKSNVNSEVLKEQSENNIIKNLKYSISLNNGIQYEIEADSSEIVYKNDEELVQMKKVVALVLDPKKLPLTIISDEATYNNSNYNTNFRKNVKIQYMNNIIYSDKLDLDFLSNFITIFDDVQYEGINNTLKADIIKINLITKKIDIYMDKKGKNVEITANNVKY